MSQVIEMRRSAEHPGKGDRLRILQLIPTLVVGGAERMAARLASHLHEWGHTVEVVSMYPPFDSWIEAELRGKGIVPRFLGKRPGLDLRMVPRIAAVLRTFRPDVVHTHLYVLKYAIPALALGGRRRVVHTLHNVAEREAGRSSRVIQGLAFKAGVIPVAIGEGVAESVRAVYGFSPRHVIPNGIPVSAYAPPPGAREQLRGALGIPPAAPVFLMVAMFAQGKDHGGLLRAFASERLRGLGAHLLLAGDGERRPELEQLTRELGLAKRVHFLGVRADVPGLLAAADVFVLASLYEGNPLALMEGMAAGKSVIASAVGSVPELVTHGAGILVPPGDGAALESALHELGSQLGQARAMGRQAASVARERFDDVVMARAYERLYQEMA